jgi:hypothetical protein
MSKIVRPPPCAWWHHRRPTFLRAHPPACAPLWGPLHGGANQAVLEMLDEIHQTGDDGSKFITAAKDKNSGKKLMGFGHRVYKNYDPRAKIIKKACDEVLSQLHINDPLLDIAKHLEQAALRDSYFIERKLYPNVDFYSGIIMRALGIPVGNVPGDVCDWPHAWLDCQLQGNHGGSQGPHLPATPDLHGKYAQQLSCRWRNGNNW